MSLLAQSGIEQMREPDTCLLQLLTDDPLGKKMVNTIPRRDRRQTMTEWANYDSNGKRVPPSSKRAAFRAKEVSVDTGVLPRQAMQAWQALNIGTCVPSMREAYRKLRRHQTIP
jgi:hypothetical protein